MLTWFSTALAAMLVANSPGAADSFPPYPSGVIDLGGACVGDIDGPGNGLCEWSIGSWTDKEPTPRWVVASRFIEHVDKKARWALTDRVELPSLGEGDYLSVGLCELAGQPDARIVAIVDASEDVEWYTTVRWARRLDMQTGRFVPVPESHVRCANEGYGHEA
jgi:hypothetical protein